MASINLNFSKTCSSVATNTLQQQTSHFKLLSTNNQKEQQNVYNKLSKITTIFFDLDNTLIPTRSGDSKACRKVSTCVEIFKQKKKIGNFPLIKVVCVSFLSFVCFIFLFNVLRGMRGFVR